MDSSLKNMVIVLTAVTLISSAAVGGVYMVTKDTIEQANKQKFSDAIQNILPTFETLSKGDSVKVDGYDKTLVIYKATTGDQINGYAVETTALGFTEDIKLLVGFDNTLNINKIAVLSQAETPGLGAKISNPNEPFVIQFQGKNPEDFKLLVRKDGGDVDAITASTITSRAYALAVERAYNAIINIK